MASTGFEDIGPVVLIGAGKMGLALARGWIDGGMPPERLVLVDPFASEAAQVFAEATGVKLLTSPEGVLVHVLVLAVKPQSMLQVLREVLPAVGPHTLVISIAAGISLATLSDGLDTDRVIRAMPNTPAQIGRGITGVVALDVSEDDRALADQLLGTAGAVMWFSDETRLDAVTALSGSGPAYVFYMVEAMAAAGMRQGLDPGQAMALARQTVIGAAALMEADESPISVLRENVTSPKGTTAAALGVLMAPNGLEMLMDRAVAAARERSEELGRGEK